MTALSALWLPILLSSVLVFVASSIIHMLLPWHKNDYPRMPNEEKAMDALRPLAIPPGDYVMPRCETSQEMHSPEFVEKLKRGPVMVVTVLPNAPFPMARNLVLWFIYCVVISVFAGYIAGRALPPGAPYLHVFQLVGATAFAGYVLALWQMWIWYRRALSTTFKTSVDGLIYALLTAGMFGWLWPH